MSAIVQVPAGWLVRLVRLVRAHRLGVSALALALTLVGGVGYMVFGALGVNPAAEKIRVRVHLVESGGLMAGQNVTLRGVPVGKVEGLELGAADVIATALIEADNKVPADGEVRVASLSLAGEQYLDFRPTRDGGPYLVDGDEISADRTNTPMPLWRTLAAMDRTLAQVDPAKLATVVDQFGVSPAGPQKLADLFDGGTFVVSMLDSILPQTMSAIVDGRQVIGTVRDMTPGLNRFADNANRILTGAEAKSGGYVQLLDAAPGTFHAVDNLLAANSTTMAALLGNLRVVADVTNSRVPALQEFFFPTQRGGSALDAIAASFHDGGIWALVNLYPRPSCEYDLPAGVPASPSFPEPYLYTHCTGDTGAEIVRGADNAPRPPGTPIPGRAPDGVSPQQQSNSTPVGPQSLPTTYGGPPLPPPPVVPPR